MNENEHSNIEYKKYNELFHKVSDIVKDQEGEILVTVMLTIAIAVLKANDEPKETLLEYIERNWDKNPLTATMILKESTVALDVT